MRTTIERWQDRFVERVFTDDEIAYCRSRRDPAPHFAARFAAKEAFIKAWSGSRTHQPPLLGSLDLREIEVVDDGYGRPALALHGTLAQMVGPCSTSVSLSHDGDAAIAVVLFTQSGT